MSGAHLFRLPVRQAPSSPPRPVGTTLASACGVLIFHFPVRRLSSMLLFPAHSFIRLPLWCASLSPPRPVRTSSLHPAGCSSFASLSGSILFCFLVWLNSSFPCLSGAHLSLPCTARTTFGCPSGEPLGSHVRWHPFWFPHEVRSTVLVHLVGYVVNAFYWLHPSKACPV